MAPGRGSAESAIMLFQILVGLPSLVMTEIAWWIRVAMALTCLVVLFAVAIGAIVVLYRHRAEDGPNHCRRSNSSTPEPRVALASPPLTRSSFSPASNRSSVTDLRRNGNDGGVVAC